MKAIEFRHVAKHYAGGVVVIPDFSLRVAPGEFLVLLGPSGCGKSTLLRLLAGLDSVSSGQVLIGDEDVTQRPPGQRGLAMVFQQYALYPHMTVAENMAFGLRNIGLAEAEVQRRIQTAAQMLELQPLLARLPAQLSGGQRQRVAIGRAVVKQPAAFLFDEPLSNLDAALRARTRVELARLHRQLQATMVFVTHDQVEAMTLADRIAVMKGGWIEQCAPPLEVYHRPATRFVAGFVGTPAMNFLPVVPAGPGRVRLCDTTLALPVHCEAPTELGIRPEGLTVGSDVGGECAAHGAQGLHRGALAGRVEVIERLGERTLVHLAASAGCPVVAELPRGAAEPAVGENVALTLDLRQALLFDAAGRAHHPAVPPAVHPTGQPA